MYMYYCMLYYAHYCTPHLPVCQMGVPAGEPSLTMSEAGTIMSQVTLRPCWTGAGVGEGMAVSRTERPDMDAIAQEASQLLEREGRAVFAYIFGSTAAGTDRPDSDIDFAVHVEPSVDRHTGFWAVMRLAGALQEQIGRSVHPVVLNTASPFLRFEVIRDGRVVFCRDAEALHAFQVRTFREYGDLKPMLDAAWAQTRARLKRGESGGPPTDLRASIEKARRVSRSIAGIRRERRSIRPG